MGRDADRRRRRPSHSSSRDARSVVQRDDVRTSIESDYHYSQRPARSSRSTVMPMPPAPPKAASAYAAPPSASRSYRTRRADGAVYETEIQRSAYMSGGGTGRRRRKSELSADEKYRQMRVSTGLTSSSDQESEDESDDDVLNRRSDIEEKSESESEEEEEDESDDSSPTRRRGQRRDGQILSSRRQLPEPEQESTDDSDHNGAQLARTPSNSSGPTEGHYRTPESQRRRQRLIEAPPPSMSRAETMPFQQKTSPRRKPERRRAQSEILDSQPPRSIRRPSRRSDPVILQKETSPRKPKKQASRGDSLRSNSNHRSSVLSSIISGSSGHRASSIKHGKRPKERQPTQMVECVACCDTLKPHKAYSLKCDHYMCRDCIIRPFEMSLKDPKEMPPRCCGQRISLRHVEHHFDVKFKKKWNRKYEEYTTDNRLYCPNQRCGDWIHPSYIQPHKGRPRAKCGSCGTKVCVACNGVWHSSLECPQDEDLQAFLKQAKEEGWTPCYKCKIMVDRKEGCNHMTCRCGAEFCMLCGSKWKSCDCEWFNFEPLDDVNDYYQGPGHMDDIFDSDDAPPTRTRTYSQQMRRRRAQETHDEEIARRLQYDMSLEQDSDEEEDHHGYNMSGAAGDPVGLGIGPGHHDQYRTASNIGRHRTRMRGSPVSYEHIRRDSGHKTPPRSVYDRAGYVTEVNRKRGLRGSERGDRGDSLERRLAERLSEQRVAAAPPMHMSGFAPPHMSPSGMMNQPAPPPPPPMGPYPPSMRMPMCSMPMTSSPPMMAAPPHHPFGSFPPHQAVPLHHHQSHPRGAMPDYNEGEPRSSSITAGLASGGGNNRVAEWVSHVAPGLPEEKMSRRSDDRLARVS